MCSMVLEAWWSPPNCSSPRVSAYNTVGVYKLSALCRLDQQHSDTHRTRELTIQSRRKQEVKSRTNFRESH